MPPKTVKYEQLESTQVYDDEISEREEYTDQQELEDRERYMEEKYGKN